MPVLRIREYHSSGGSAWQSYRMSHLMCWQRPLLITILRLPRNHRRRGFNQIEYVYFPDSLPMPDIP